MVSIYQTVQGLYTDVFVHNKMGKNKDHKIIHFYKQNMCTEYLTSTRQYFE